MLGDVVPKKAGRGIVNVGLLVVKRIFIGDRALEVVGPLLAAIGDLPGFLVIVRGNRRRRPEMTIPGDFAAVIKVIEHAKLQGKLVLVGRDVCAIHV